jgi:hypothetical protein
MIGVSAIRTRHYHRSLHSFTFALPLQRCCLEHSDSCIYIETHSGHFQGGETFLSHSQGRFGVSLGISRYWQADSYEKEIMLNLPDRLALVRRKG